MGLNPFHERGIPLEKQFRNWSEPNVKPDDKNSVDPNTQCRVITMNGIEVESVIFSHQFARHITDMDLKRQLATVRRVEHKSNPISLLHALTMTAAEQQTMNFYMNMGNRPLQPLAHGLYLEIATIEEQHVSHYESMMDAGAAWAQTLVLRGYNECCLYHSSVQTEVDPRIKQLRELHLAMEIEHFASRAS